MTNCRHFTASYLGLYMAVNNFVRAERLLAIAELLSADDISSFG